MMQHSENYKFYLYLTRDNFRVNAIKYGQYLNAKQFTDNVKPKKTLAIQKTVMP